MIGTLRFALVAVAIICELYLSNGTMILVLAGIGITGRYLVSYAERRALHIGAEEALRAFVARAQQYPE